MFLLLLLSLQDAFARIGSDPDQRVETPEFACRLSMIDIDGNSSFCTASLIAPDRILTAGHCLGKTIASIDCGYHLDSKNRPAFKVSLGGNQFTVERREYDRKKTAKEFVFSDFAVIKLRKAVSTIQPIALYDSSKKLLEEMFSPASEQVSKTVAQARGLSWKNIQGKYEYFSLKKNVDCRVTGFGNAFNNRAALENVDKNRKTSKENFNSEHQMAITAMMDLSEMKDYEFVAVKNADQEIVMYQHTAFFQTGSKNKTTLEHGDSGGPLFCRAKKEDPYRLVGINQSLWNAGTDHDSNYGGNVFTYFLDEVQSK